MYNTRKLTSFHKKKELLKLVDLDLNPLIKHAGLVPVRPPVRLGKRNKTLINGKIGTGNTVGARRLSKKNELQHLVDLDLNSPNKHAGLASAS